MESLKFRFNARNNARYYFPYDPRDVTEFEIVTTTTRKEFAEFPIPKEKDKE